MSGHALGAVPAVWHGCALRWLGGLSGILSFWWMDRYVDMLFLLRALHLADTIFYQWMLYDGCAKPSPN